MTIESMIGALSTDEKLVAMDLLWRDLSATGSKYVSPSWHQRVLAERISNPDSRPKLGLEAAEAEVRKALDEYRTEK